MTKSTGQVKLIIEFLDQAFSARAWHGTTLRGSVRNVDYQEAAWRPTARHHNIREIALHAAYWKYIIWRKISGKTDVSFPYPGNNWPKLTGAFDKKTWDKDKALLKEYHDLLIAELKSFPDSKLKSFPPKSRYKYSKFLLGIGSHDLYHAGQIQLLKRLKRGGAVK